MQSHHDYCLFLMTMNTFNSDAGCVTCSISRRFSSAIHRIPIPVRKKLQVHLPLCLFVMGNSWISDSQICSWITAGSTSLIVPKRKSMHLGPTFILAYLFGSPLHLCLISFVVSELFRVRNLSWGETIELPRLVSIRAMHRELLLTLLKSVLWIFQDCACLIENLKD